MTGSASPTKPPRSRLLLIGLLVGTVVAVLAVLPSFVLATMSVMVAAAGTNGWVAAYLVLAFGLPVVVILGPALAWIAYLLRRERIAWGLLISPAIWAGCAFALLALMPGGSG